LGSWVDDPCQDQSTLLGLGKPSYTALSNQTNGAKFALMPIGVPLSLHAFGVQGEWLRWFLGLRTSLDLGAM